MSYADCTPEEIDLMENAFGDHIRRRREQLGLSARDVSSRCGLPPAALNQIEAGQQPPDLEKVPSLANALELDPAALCRLALLTAYPLFYATLTAESETDLAAAFDPSLSALVETDAEDAGWIRQLRQIPSHRRHLLRQLAGELAESSHSPRRRVPRGQVLLKF